MATIKSFTSLEQSKKLAEFLPLESADILYWAGEYITHPYMEGQHKDEQIPIWSLAALLGVLPKPKVYYSTDKVNRWYCDCWNNDGNFITSTKASNPVDACYEMLCWLLENKMI